MQQGQDARGGVGGDVCMGAAAGTQACMAVCAQARWRRDLVTLVGCGLCVRASLVMAGRLWTLVVKTMQSFSQSDWQAKTSEGQPRRLRDLLLLRAAVACLI